MPLLRFLSVAVVTVRAPDHRADDRTSVGVSTDSTDEYECARDAAPATSPARPVTHRVAFPVARADVAPASAPRRSWKLRSAADRVRPRPVPGSWTILRRRLR